MGLLLAVTLTAGQYATLKDGTVIILKDDGTWERVTPQKSVPKVGQPQADNAPAQEKVQTQQSEKAVDPLTARYAQRLQGVWRSGDGKERLEISGKRALFVSGRTRRGGPFEIEKIDAQKGAFTLVIGETERVGKFAFGGMRRRFVFEGADKLVDPEGGLLPVTLQRQKR